MTVNNTIETPCPQCGAPVPMPDYADMAVCTFCGSTLSRERLLPSGPGPTIGEARLAAAWRGEAAAPHGPTTAAGTPEEKVLHSVRCPQCAGPLSAREGRRVLVCRHCGTRVAVKEHGGVSRWYLPARVDHLAAAAAGAAWLRERPGLAKQTREARLTDARLVYAPIWEYKALLAGWEFGYKMRTQAEPVGSAPLMVHGLGFEGEDERLALRLVKEGVKEPRLQERRFYQAATDFEALGATRPRMTGRELLVPLLAGEIDDAATVLEAEGTGRAVAERGRGSLLQPLSAALSADCHLFTFRETTSLLYYPLWLLRYQAGDRSCRVVVNGRDGAVNSAFAPADDRRRVALLAVQVILAAVVVAFLVWLAVTRVEARMSMVAAAVIVSVVVALWVSRFRMAGEVEYHEPFSG